MSAAGWSQATEQLRSPTVPRMSGFQIHSNPKPASLLKAASYDLSKSLGHEQGWFLVSDPATLRQGSIYEKYYLEAIRGPGQTQLAVQDLPSPTRVALAAPKPKPVSRVKNRRPQQKIANQPSKRTRVANDEFASLIERAFRGY
jgi:hypothetical protein